MDTFINSPVWGAIITVSGTALVGVSTLIIRLMAKMNQISDKVDTIAEDVAEIKNDDNIVRWSDLNRSDRRRRKNGL